MRVGSGGAGGFLRNRPEEGYQGGGGGADAPIVVGGGGQGNLYEDGHQGQRGGTYPIRDLGALRGGSGKPLGAGGFLGKRPEEEYQGGGGEEGISRGSASPGVGGGEELLGVGNLVDTMEGVSSVSWGSWTLARC